jgi:bifunctional DNase/RNase
LNFYEKTIDDLFESVAQVVGIHVFVIVLERALWKTKLKYEEAVMIQISEDGVLLRELSEVEPDRATLVAHEFLINIVNTLGHLVGRQLAKQLTEELDELVIEK